ncbi:heterochromatin protein 1-binding protein 3 [Austrofundulus limnaeus]|uniref:Heterochromatin protein 1-binding protein 3 n=1 Tax=Austrofundulus limnaeus TaxID=52670 RepID=A0A2I4BB43_AUSLI|nr:PREDICTED: heterochromatin protein 1-binding protein 3 [Austrofundulus limnaeus]
MPIRRAAATPPAQEKAPSAAEEREPEASDEESPSPDEEQAASSAAGAEDGEGENSGDTHPDKNEDDAEEEGAEDEKKDEKDVKCPDCEAGQCTTHCFVLLLRLKDGYKYEKSKTKKVKRTIPAWASVTASKNIPVTNYAGTQCRVDSVLIEAIMSSKDKAGISFQSLMKYILKKYPNMELDKKKKFLIKKAMKKHVEKGTVKQLKGKGLSGRFAIGKKPPPSKKGRQKQESLGDALPLIFTRLCEPKEASYTLIKKYLKQHFPNFNIENRPDVLKTALGKAVEKGHLEQVTGKGAQGTFQLKHSGKDAQLKGSTLEDAITVAIVAMNEPKTCSATSLRKYLIDSNKDVKEHLVVANLKRTLTKCKVLGWMKVINEVHMFSYFVYPCFKVLSFVFSPKILYPDNFKELPKKPTRRRHTADSSDEEEEEEEDEEEEESESEDEAPRKRRSKALSRTNRRPPPSKRAQRASPSKAKSRGRTPAKKSPVKAAASSAKKGGRKQSAVKKESTATPVKRGAPSRKPKKPAVKRLSQRATKKPVYKESSPEPEESEESEVEEEPTRGGSKRARRESSPDEPEVEKETKRGGSKRSKPESSPKAPKAEKATARGGSKRSKPEETTPEEPPVKKQATKGGSKRHEPESSPEKADVKKEKSNKKSPRKSKRGKN